MFERGREAKEVGFADAIGSLRESAAGAPRIREWWLDNHLGN